MFIQKYLNDFYYKLLLDNYEYDYLMSLDEHNFSIIYDLFKENNFYFIDDIIIKFLEIFTLPYDEVKRKIIDLKASLGENFVYIIGNDLKYMNYFIN